MAWNRLKRLSCNFPRSLSCHFLQQYLLLSKISFIIFLLIVFWFWLDRGSFSKCSRNSFSICSWGFFRKSRLLNFHWSEVLFKLGREWVLLVNLLHEERNFVLDAIELLCAGAALERLVEGLIARLFYFVQLYGRFLFVSGKPTFWRIL